MTQDIIQAITQAEEQATEMKRQASAKAAEILSSAEQTVAQTETNSIADCKAYAETQIQNAKVQAEQRFVDTLHEEKQKAKAYCVSVLENAEPSVMNIVGRIVRGNR